MKSLKDNQSGFGFLVLLLVVVVVGAALVVGLRVVGSSNASKDNSALFVHSAKVPKSINSASDVNQASAALDATSVDNGVNPDQLNSDLSSLL